ncbi:MAG: ATP-binding protein [Leptospiraceae bacterium]|nr:ATP-binding protein [Leptospiraceae bacterium]
MKLDFLLPNLKAGLADCPNCAGVGLVLDEIVPNSRNAMMEVCYCVKDYCYKCSSKGNPPYLSYDPDQNRMLPCYCHQARVTLSEMEKRFKAAKIPPKYQFKFLDTMDMRTNNPDENLKLLVVQDWARGLIESFPKKQNELQGMYLYGGPGTGKTHIACTILNELIIRYGAECRYAKITKDFLSALRDSYQKESENYGQEKGIEEEFATIDVLVIDDFGVQKDTDWANAKLYDLIDSRYENQKLTLLTSNQPLAEWKDKAEGRVFSRLCEMVMEMPINCSDYRLRYHTRSAV